MYVEERMYIEECLCVEINVSVDMESIYQIVPKLTARSALSHY